MPPSERGRCTWCPETRLARDGRASLSSSVETGWVPSPDVTRIHVDVASGGSVSSSRAGPGSGVRTGRRSDVRRSGERFRRPWARTRHSIDPRRSRVHGRSGEQWGRARNGPGSTDREIDCICYGMVQGRRPLDESRRFAGSELAAGPQGAELSVVNLTARSLSLEDRPRPGAYADGSSLQLGEVARGLLTSFRERAAGDIGRGRTDLLVMVDSTGRPVISRILSSSGRRTLDQAALTAAMLDTPGTGSDSVGTAVSRWYVVPISWMEGGPGGGGASP